jgi:protein TonB
MLAYAANRPVVAQRPSSPSTLLIVIGLHVGLIAAVVSAKLDLPDRIRHAPIAVDLIPQPKAPPPESSTKPSTRPQTNDSHIDRTDPIVTTNPLAGPVTVDDGKLDPGPVVGPINIPTPDPLPRPTVIARTEAMLVTPAWDLKPPYPASKIASEEEAVLRLRIAIDERGRVIAVEPLGPVDRAFLDSARRHLLAHWRYKPALEDGRPVASSMVIRLRFHLEG